MNRREFIKVTDNGQTFRLSLFEDGTVKEWRVNEDESRAWAGRWQHVDLKSGRSIELDVAGYKTSFDPAGERLTGTEVSEGTYGSKVSLYCLETSDPRSWVSF